MSQRLTKEGFAKLALEQSEEIDKLKAENKELKKENIYYKILYGEPGDNQGKVYGKSPIQSVWEFSIEKQVDELVSVLKKLEGATITEVYKMKPCDIQQISEGITGVFQTAPMVVLDFEKNKEKKGLALNIERIYFNAGRVK